MTWKHFLHYWPFVRKFINAVPSQMASYAQLQFFLNCQPKQATEQTIKLPVIWNMIHKWCHCNESDLFHCVLQWHYMSIMGSQITSILAVCSTVCLGKHHPKTSKPPLLTLCEGNPPVTGGFPSQRASNTDTISMSCHHYDSWEIQLRSRANQSSTSICITASLAIVKCISCCQTQGAGRENPNPPLDACKSGRSCWGEYIITEIGMSFWQNFHHWNGNVLIFMKFHH